MPIAVSGFINLSFYSVFYGFILVDILVCYLPDNVHSNGLIK